MAYGLYDGSLESIPGLGGYLQQTKLNQQADAHNLQSGVQIMSMLKEHKAQQDDANIRAAMSQGGTPADVVNRLGKLGTPQAIAMANHYMTLNQSMATQDAFKNLNLTDAAGLDKLALTVAPHNPALANSIQSISKTLNQREAAQGEHQAQMGTEASITTAPTMGFQPGRGFAERATIPASAALPDSLPSAPGTRQQVDTSAIPPDEMAAFLAAQQGIALGRPMAVSAAPSSNPAENTQRTGALFEPFAGNEQTRGLANSNQQAVNSSNPLTTSPSIWDNKVASLNSTLLTQGFQNTRAAQSNTTANHRIDVGAESSASNREAANARAGLNPDGTPMAGTGLSHDAIETAAERYRIDRTLPPNMGRGAQGALEIKRVLNRAAEMAAQDGLTAEEQSLRQIANKASAQGLGQISRQEATLGAFEKNAVSNADLALQASEKVDRTGIPVFNRWLQAGRTAITGDEDARVFNAANSTFVSEYAKVMSGGTGAAATTEGATHRAQDLLNTADTKEAYRKVIGQLKLEMRNRMTGFAQQKQELMQGMGSQPNQGASTAPTPVALPPNQVKLPDGRIKNFPSGAAAQAYKAAAGL